MPSIGAAPAAALQARPDDPAAPPGQRDGAFSGLLLLVSATLLGHCLWMSEGWYNGIYWMLAAWVVCLLATFLPRVDRLEAIARDRFHLVAGVLLTWEFFAVVTTSPGNDQHVNLFRALSDFLRFVVIAGAVAFTMVGGRPPLGRWSLPLVLLMYAGAELWLIHASPSPFNDVFYFHRGSTHALLHGADPYALTFKDIYYGLTDNVYGKDVAAGGTVNTGFPYPPLSLVLSTVGALLGDFRIAHAAAATLTALLISRMRPGPVAGIVAVLFLFTPRLFLLLEIGFTEALVAFFFAALVLGACRRPRWVPWLAGPFVAVKHYGFFVLPLVGLLGGDRRWRWRVVWVSLAIAVATAVPFFLWDPAAFWRTLVLLQFRQPFRADTCTVLNWFYYHGHADWFERPWGITIASLAGFVMAAVVGFLAYRRCPRTPAGFATAAAAQYFTFFAFNKQAFLHYYYFVIAAMCCAAGANAALNALPGGSGSRADAAGSP